jgi:ribosomal protein S18 acetylase RimI-like enzyme
VRVRGATGADLPQVAETLAAAFLDDPIMAWCYPDADRRREILPRGFEIIAASNLPHGGVLTTDDGVGAAVWVPPGVEDDEEALRALLEVSAEYGSRVVQAFELMTAAHPEAPHQYLFLLATRPGWQSRGIGSALMRPVLEACDRDGLPAYLEATCERNVGLYQRHGFRVTGEIALPEGPSLWPMWREPR